MDADSTVPATKADIQLLLKQFDRVFIKLDEHEKRFDKFDTRFDSVDKRFKLINKRLDLVDKRFKSIDKRFTEVNAQLQFLANALQRYFNELSVKIDEQKEYFDQKMYNNNAEVLALYIRPMSKAISSYERRMEKLEN